MKPYQTVAIKECGERLVPLPAELFSFQSPHPYRELGAPYGDRSPFYLREGVVERLFEAQEQLQALRPGWRLRIFDGFRPLAVQKFMVKYTLEELARSRDLDLKRLSDGDRENLMAEVYQFWAEPSSDPNDPPPHSTGGAVDLTLVNATNQVANMGSPIDEISPRSHPDYFADATEEPERTYHQNRQLLANVMASADFVQHPNEWWHFCYGERMWAWQKQKPHAIYSGGEVWAG